MRPDDKQRQGRIGPFAFFVTSFLMIGFGLLPELAEACAVCTNGQQEESRKAFIGTTAFMTFFPLAMLGIVVGLFLRRTLAMEREEEEAASRESQDVEHATRR